MRGRWLRPPVGIRSRCCAPVRCGAAGGYSGKVQQPARIWTDAGVRSRTVTCGDGCWWTSCLLFASRGPGVQVPLAPQVSSKIRTSGSRVQQESTAVGTCLRARLHIRAGLSRGDSDCWHGQRIPRAEGRFQPADQDESLRLRSCGHLALLACRLPQRSDAVADSCRSRRGSAEARGQHLNVTHGELSRNTSQRSWRALPNRNVFCKIGIRPPWARRTSLLHKVWASAKGVALWPIRQRASMSLGLETPTQTGIYTQGRRRDETAALLTEALERSSGRAPRPGRGRVRA
jgi:hypothetical protein